MSPECLDDKDKEILNIIQWDFPLVVRPFKEIGARLNISEDEALARIRRIKESGLIRQINAIFDTRALGYKSALVAMSIEQDKLEYVANEINKHEGVSHNYERDHEYNLWFTIAVPPDGNIKTDVERFAKLKGVKKYRILPTLKLYKIGVKLDMVNDEQSLKPNEDKKESKEYKLFKLNERDKEFIRELQKDIELVKEPFNTLAQRLNVSVNELLGKAKEYQANGIMRRFAAILRHRDAGFIANGMIVWNIPDEIIDEIGYKIAAYPQVSHCYRRPRYEDWPYNLFSMVHARSNEACINIASMIANDINIHDYKILFSIREFKKERVKYYVKN
jgi:DNA-binding Lrp family transcriptional regulator